MPTKPRTYYDPNPAVGAPELLSRPWITPMRVPRTDGLSWEEAYLTEYHPNTPKTETAKKQLMEGGAYDRHPGRDKHPVIWWEQHVSDPTTYPFVTVASDLTLRGRKVPYGARLYLEAFPNVEFRLMDTGGHFFGPGKVIRQPGHEPFDIATSYPAASAERLRISGTKTRYRVDFNDVIDYPRWLIGQRERAPVA